MNESDCSHCTRCPLLGQIVANCLPTEAVEDLKKTKQTLSLDSESDITDYLMDPDSIVILKSGLLKIFLRFNGAQVLRVVYSGEVVSTDGIIESLSNGTKVVATSGTKLCKIPRGDFVRMLKVHDVCLSNFLKSTRDIQNENIVQNLSVSHLSTKQRLAAFLERDFTLRAERGSELLTIAQVYSHDEIGLILGVARETVSRLLMEFRKSGIINVMGRKMVLSDAVGLKQQIIDRVDAGA